MVINNAFGKWIVPKLSVKYQRKLPLVILFVIDMMNSVHSLPTILSMEVIPLVKMTRHHFILFCFVLIFFHCNSRGKYRGNIFVGKIHWQFTNENIPSVFLFIFANFLVVSCEKLYGYSTCWWSLRFVSHYSIK